MELGLHVWPSDATCRAVWDKFPWPSRLGQVWKSWTYFLLKLQKANIARACGGNHMLTSGCGFLDISHGSPGEWQFDDVKSTLSPHQINNKLLSYAFLVPFAGFWWCFVKLSPQKNGYVLNFTPPQTDIKVSSPWWRWYLGRRKRYPQSVQRETFWKKNKQRALVDFVINKHLTHTIHVWYLSTFGCKSNARTW